MPSRHWHFLCPLVNAASALASKEPVLCLKLNAVPPVTPPAPYRVLSKPTGSDLEHAVTEVRNRLRTAGDFEATKGSAKILSIKLIDMFRAKRNKQLPAGSADIRMLEAQRQATYGPEPGTSPTKSSGEAMRLPAEASSVVPRATVTDLSR